MPSWLGDSHLRVVLTCPICARSGLPVVAMLTWLTLEGHPQLAHAVASRGGLVRAVQGL